MHGAGNDYVYVDARSLKNDWASVAVSISNRNFGVGSDGLILAEESSVADVKMSMYNSDGSQGEMCGNGIRCLVAFSLINDIVPKKDIISVETLAGIKHVTPIYQGDNIVRCSVSMGPPEFNASKIPVQLDHSVPIIDFPITIEEKTYYVSMVSMGNPHAVVFLESPVDDYNLTDIGPKFENLEIFPNRTNFEIVNVVDDANLKVRVWERGSGITLACGTGACAVGVVARLKGLISDSVNIILPGGNLSVHWDGNSEVRLEGPVESVFEGQLL
tara:strand:- start:43497 stop:44315 length:819 start_codon:yes stop_codon:yes gene_type:complete